MIKEIAFLKATPDISPVELDRREHAIRRFDEKKPVNSQTEAFAGGGRGRGAGGPTRWRRRRGLGKFFAGSTPRIGGAAVTRTPYLPEGSPADPRNVGDIRESRGRGGGRPPPG